MPSPPIPTGADELALAYDSADPMEVAGSAAEKEDSVMESGLILARVELGGQIGEAVAEDYLPSDVKRRPGVAVRATFMHYGLAGDGTMTAERVRRFVRQMHFRRRELGLPHGSLVSGIGSWGGPENVPIKLFGFRLTDANDGQHSISSIEGVSDMPTPTCLAEACKTLKGVVPGIESAVKNAQTAAKGLHRKGSRASEVYVAALYLYTMAHAFYQQLNAAMRHFDRSRAKPFFGYLKLLFCAMESLVQNEKKQLWRGVNLDLSRDHVVGDEVVWWGASSCTPKLAVAQGFLGNSGKRTLFSVASTTAVPIKECSAFRGEEEWLLAPGTRLRVEKVTNKQDEQCEISLAELPPPRSVR